MSEAAADRAGIQGVIWRAVVLALASSVAVCFPLVLGRVLWPQGLSSGAEFIFWLASGVNIGCLVLFGWRYWPAILFGLLPAIFLLGEPVGRSVFGVLGNVVEALIGWVILTRVGRLTGVFDRVKTVMALLLTAVAAPALASLVVPGWLVANGTFTLDEFWAAVGNWNLANGVGILVVTPFVLALSRRPWMAMQRKGEALAWLVGGLATGVLAFDAVFQARGLNFVFLAFPLVILVAVRFGPQETAAALLVVVASVYLALSRHATELAQSQAPDVIWFVQACCWVLAATGLLVGALMAERRRAEALALEEQARRMEASLREERARLAALRYQINPHFLFNTLNSVRATLPLEEKVPREMITDLAGYLRSTLNHEDVDRVPLGEELRSARKYLAIEGHRFGERLQVSIEADREAEKVLVPVFLVQPLLENAIRHGLEASREPCQLKIKAHLSADRLVLEVANTGVWREKPGGTGIGLKNIRRRLELLSGGDAGLEVMREPGWIRIVIGMSINPASGGSEG